MSNYIGRTMEQSGFWFRFEANFISVRTAVGNSCLPHSGDLVFRFGDMRDDVIPHHIRLIGRTLNLGSRLRGRDIRATLGIEPADGHRPADYVFDERKPKYEIKPGPHGPENKGPWVLSTTPQPK